MTDLEQILIHLEIAFDTAFARRKQSEYRDIARLIELNKMHIQITMLSDDQISDWIKEKGWLQDLDNPDMYLYPKQIGASVLIRSDLVIEDKIDTRKKIIVRLSDIHKIEEHRILDEMMAVEVT